MRTNKIFLSLTLFFFFAFITSSIFAKMSNPFFSDTIKGYFTVDVKYHINDVYVYLISNEYGEKYRIVGIKTKIKTGKKIKTGHSYYFEATSVIFEFVHGIKWEYYNDVFIRVDDGYGWNIYTSENVNGKYYLDKQKKVVSNLH